MRRPPNMTHKGRCSRYPTGKYRPAASFSINTLLADCPSKSPIKRSTMLIGAVVPGRVSYFRGYSNSRVVTPGSSTTPDQTILSAGALMPNLGETQPPWPGTSPPRAILMLWLGN